MLRIIFFKKKTKKMIKEEQVKERGPKLNIINK